MAKTDDTMIIVMKEANGLRKSKEEIATFVSSETNQTFNVLTTEQLKLLGVDTLNAQNKSEVKDGLD